MTAPTSAGWSPWRPVPGAPGLMPAVLRELLDGGQAFRWYGSDDGGWTGAWSDCVVRLRLTASNRLEWSAPAPVAPRVGERLPSYLGLDVDFAAVADALPWRSDPHLARCLAAFPGLRLLRQPFGETLLAFLCSATKQIVQIKQMVALLAERLGSTVCVATGVPTALVSGQTTARRDPAALTTAPVRQLPTWAQLAEVPESELRGCLLGFRAKYIAGTARFLAEHNGWLEETERQPYAEAKARLCLLPGVGEKVADCVLLFGAGRLEAFPVDVWILKTMARRYGLEAWGPTQLTQFGRVHFGAAAGLAQQFLFAWERREARL